MDDQSEISAPKNKNSFDLNDNIFVDIFDDIVSFRNFLVPKNDYYVLPAKEIARLLTVIIENELRRKSRQKLAQNNSQNTFPVNDPIYKWFCYYQDKCHELEKQLESTFHHNK